MKRWPVLLCLSFVLFAEAAGAADPVFGDSVTFRLNIPGGHFDSVKRDLTCAIDALRGSVTFHKYRRRGTWRPVLSVILRYGKEPKERSVVLRFAAPAIRPPFIIEMLGTENDATLSAQINFDSTVGADGTFSFLLLWNAAGDVTADAGGQQYTLILGQRPQQLEISISSGDADVVYQLGHSADEKVDSGCKLAA